MSRKSRLVIAFVATWLFPFFGCDLFVGHGGCWIDGFFGQRFVTIILGIEDWTNPYVFLVLGLILLQFFVYLGIAYLLVSLVTKAIKRFSSKSSNE